MDVLDRLERAGFLVVRDFLDGETCERLCEEARTAAPVAATISNKEGATTVDEQRRRTKLASIPAGMQAALDSRLQTLAPAVVERFGDGATMLERSQLLVYRRGDFFRPHRDSSSDPRIDERVRARRVSAIAFLNRQSRLPEPGAFCGGSLTFFRVDGGSDAAAFRLEVPAEPGVLIGFPAHVMHEVRPVTHGERYTLVTWFAAPPAADGDVATA